MDHPKILPDTKRFSYCADGKYFNDQQPHWLLIAGRDHVLFHNTIYHDPAACAGRCDWLEEAERWAKLPFNDCKNFDDMAAFRVEAMANAEAWLEYGKTGRITP